MNKYLKEFLHRGLMFSGFGPVISGIVYLVLNYTINDFSVSGKEIFFAIISTYLLAFVHAGVSVFNQIEEWGIAKAIICHFGALYVAYTLCYIFNSWIPFDWKIFAIYTAIFAAVYFVIWVTVYICISKTSKKMNSKL